MVVRQFGSGVVVSQSGLIVTAAHVVAKQQGNTGKTTVYYPKEVLEKMIGGEDGAPQILIGLLQEDEKSTKWMYRARIVTSVSDLCAMHQGCPLDLAVLQIHKEVQCIPPSFTGFHQKHIAVTAGATVAEDFKLRSWLAVSSPGPSIKAGEDFVWLLGYPIHADSILVDRKLVSGMKVGWYQIDARNIARDGMSGGPALSSEGKVMGILYGDLHGLSCYRDISLYPKMEQIVPSMALLSSPPSPPPLTPRTPLGGTGKPGSSASQGPLKGRIEALEKGVFEEASHGGTLRERQALLECRVLGEEQSGSLEARVRNLEQQV